MFGQFLHLGDELLALLFRHVQVGRQALDSRVQRRGLVVALGAASRNAFPARDVDGCRKPFSKSIELDLERVGPVPRRLDLVVATGLSLAIPLLSGRRDILIPLRDDDLALLLLRNVAVVCLLPARIRLVAIRLRLDSRLVGRLRLRPGLVDRDLRRRCLVAETT